MGGRAIGGEDMIDLNFYREAVEIFLILLISAFSYLMWQMNKINILLWKAHLKDQHNIDTEKE